MERYCNTLTQRSALVCCTLGIVLHLCTGADSRIMCAQKHFCLWTANDWVAVNCLLYSWVITALLLCLVHLQTNRRLGADSVTMNIDIIRPTKTITYVIWNHDYRETVRESRRRTWPFSASRRATRASRCASS